MCPPAGTGPRAGWSESHSAAAGWISVAGRCPLLRISFVDSISHGQADLYAAPMCSTADGLGVDGLTRPFVSLEGPDYAGVYQLGYRRLHLVVPRYSLLSVSPVGDMLVGPRIAAPASGTPGLRSKI